MQKLYYQFPEHGWRFACHLDMEINFYLYHQRDTRKPGPFGEPFWLGSGNNFRLCTLRR